MLDETYYERAFNNRETGSIIVGGDNYGQGSSREHAVLAPRFLGVKVVLVKSFARIHWQNLANFGILPLTFNNPDDYETIDRDDILKIQDVRSLIQNGTKVQVVNQTKNATYETERW